MPPRHGRKQSLPDRRLSMRSSNHRSKTVLTVARDRPITTDSWITNAPGSAAGRRATDQPLGERSVGLSKANLS